MQTRNQGYGVQRGAWSMRLALIAAMAGTGCARVDPHADFNTAAHGVSERTGATDVYDPAADDLVAAKVEALLADGVTVDEAVQIALLNNRAFQSLFQSIGVSRADVVQSGLISNPTLALSVQFPEGGGRSDITAGWGQQLVDLWQIPVRKRIATAELEQTINRVLERGIELAADTRVRCYRLLAVERAQEIARENLTLADRSVEYAQTRFNAGEVSQLDVNLARTNVLDVRQLLIGLDRDRRVAELDVARILGLSRRTGEWHLHDALDGRSLSAMDENSLVQQALDNRMDIRIAAAQLVGAEQQLRLEFLKVFPNVNLGLAFERNDVRAQTARHIPADTARASVAAGKLTAPTIQSRAERDFIRRQVIDAKLGPSLELTLPIFDQNQAQIAKARYTVLARRKDYEDIQDEAARLAGVAAAGARTAAELVRFFEQQALPQARENLENATRLYREGEQSVIVLVESQSLLIERQRAYVDAIRDQAIAIAELERAIGGRLSVDIVPATTQPASMPAALEAPAGAAGMP